MEVSSSSKGPHSLLMPASHTDSSQGSSRRGLVHAVLITQVLSIALATTGVSSQALTNQGVYAPTTQAFFNYCLLALVFGSCSVVVPLIQHRQHSKASTSTDRGSSEDAAACPADPSSSGGVNSSSSSSSTPQASSLWLLLRRSWASFAALALIDVEANVLVTKAYQYTSLTSVTLLDCFTIPWVMLLSWMLLRARYRAGHYIGGLCCIAGLAVLVLGDSQGGYGNSSNNSSGGQVGLSDWLHAPSGVFTTTPAPPQTVAVSSSSGGSAGSRPLLGDCLVLLGAVLYGVCNVTQELLLADVAPGQLLALLGLFGALISGAQAALLEHDMLLSMHWSSVSVLLPMAGFAAAMFTFYSLVPRVLMLGGATVLNLGLLTSDGWAALARYLWFGGFQGWTAYFFVASLLLVAGGLVVYTLSGSPKDDAEAATGRHAGTTGRAAAAAGQHVGYSRLRVDGDLEEQHGCAAAGRLPGQVESLTRPAS